MKKRYLSLLLGMILSLSTVISANAGTAGWVKINGVEISSSEGTTFDQNGFTFVPIGAAVKNMGDTYNYDDTEGPATIKLKSNKTIELTVGKSVAVVDGKDVPVCTKVVNGAAVPLNVKPILKNNLLYVPVEFVQNVLAYPVAKVTENGATVIYVGSIPSTVKLQTQSTFDGSNVSTPSNSGSSSSSKLSNSGSSTIRTGWVNINGKRYYIKADGSKATGWLQANGEWYYFWSDGTPATGWLQSGGNWYYLYPFGDMAHDTMVSGYYLNSDGVWTKDIPTSAWSCPQIKSAATSDVSAGFKTLHDELGFGYTSGWAGYSNYVDNPTSASPTALDVTKLGTKTHNAELMIVINQWKDDPNIQNSYRVKPIAQQLFKFYFGDDYVTLYNILEYDFSANLNKVITVGNRQVLMTRPDGNGLMIWVSAPGEHISL